jgi:hypothetical protein
MPCIVDAKAEDLGRAGDWRLEATLIKRERWVRPGNLLTGGVEAIDGQEIGERGGSGEASEVDHLVINGGTEARLAVANV